ncbi:MAG: hypothetical protein EH225_10050, partial [Calditrichaeota bacterium]
MKTKQQINKDPLDFRTDAAHKIRGKTRYVKDMHFPGMWKGMTIRCPHTRARIHDILVNNEFDWDSITVVTASDIPHNVVVMLENDMPFLADEICNYAGEPIILLAAPEEALLEEAARHIFIDFEDLPFIGSMRESENNDVRIFGDDNVFKHIRIERGNPELARKKADHIIEIEVETGFQEHLYLEPQGIIAVPEKDRITIHGSMQCPYYVKNALTHMFAGQKHITVIQSATGGAFGGKEDFPSLLAGHAALLAAKSGHPVGMFYNREEDVQFTPKRHPSLSRHKAYVNRDGKVLGAELNILLDGGAYCTLSQVVLARSALTALGCYHVPSVRIEAKVVATNSVPSGAFRGFGGPQAVFAIEMLIEKIARTLKLYPDRVRKINLIKEGEKTATGQELKYSVSAHETFDDVVQKSSYQKKYEQYRRHNTSLLKKMKEGIVTKENKEAVFKGIGISASLHGAGFTGTGENKIKGKIRITLNPQGKIIIFTGSTEMGQGEETALRNIMARSLQIAREDVILAEVNTDIVPDSGPTVASRTTMIVGSLLVEAGKEIVTQLSRKIEKEKKCHFSFSDGTFRSNGLQYSFREVAERFSGLTVEKVYRHPPQIQFDDIHWKGDAYPVFSWAAAVAEIEVDPITF